MGAISDGQRTGVLHLRRVESLSSVFRTITTSQLLSRLGMWRPSLLTILLLDSIHCKRYKRYVFGS